MSNIDRVCLGTWQFEDVTEATAASLIDTAHEVGITWFDTANVYAGGKAELLLGRMCNENDQIITKIPAVNKRSATIEHAYPLDHTKAAITTSIARLNRLPAVFLLHNWNAAWENQSQNYVSKLKDCVRESGVESFGVSLPNGYNGQIESSEEMRYLDYIEAPLNDLTPMIDKERLAKIGKHVNVLSRSIFKHGDDTINIPEKFKDALSSGGSIVVGATKPIQIRGWREII